MRVWLSSLSITLVPLLMLSGAWADELEVLTGDDMQARIVGNTMVGMYDGAGGKWREYFDPSGEIRGTDEEHGTYSARYEIRPYVMCFDYPWEGHDWCCAIGLQGDKLTFYKDGREVTSIRDSQLLPGNPYEF